jgi:hypothetical protein
MIFGKDLSEARSAGKKDAKTPLKKNGATRTSTTETTTFYA